MNFSEIWTGFTKVMLNAGKHLLGSKSCSLTYIIITKPKFHLARAHSKFVFFVICDTIYNSHFHSPLFFIFFLPSVTTEWFSPSFHHICCMHLFLFIIHVSAHISDMGFGSSVPHTHVVFQCRHSKDGRTLYRVHPHLK